MLPRPKYMLQLLTPLWYLGWMQGLVQRLIHPRQWKLPKSPQLVAASQFPTSELPEGHPLRAGCAFIVEVELGKSDAVLTQHVCRLVAQAFLAEPTALTIFYQPAELRGLSVQDIRVRYESLKSDPTALGRMQRVIELLLPAIMATTGSRLFVLADQADVRAEGVRLFAAVVFGGVETSNPIHLAWRLQQLGEDVVPNLQRVGGPLVVDYFSGWLDVYSRWVTRAYTVSYLGIDPSVAGRGVGLTFLGLASDMVGTDWPIVGYCSALDGQQRWERYGRIGYRYPSWTTALNGIPNRRIYRPAGRRGSQTH